jgi:hypothetical protein
MLLKFAAVLSCALAVRAGEALGQSPANVPASAPGRLNQSRTPHWKPTPGVIEEMTVKELGNFDYDEEKGGTIPADVSALDGTTIRLTGYMIPMNQSEKIAAFALVEDLFAVPQRAPLIQQTIVVNMPATQPTNYFPDRITVEGKLRVRAKKEDGFIVSIFDLDATSVKAKAPDASRSASTQPH